MPEDQNRAALMQQFQAAIAGMSPGELQQVLGTLLQAGEERLWPSEPDRPNLRRPPRTTPAVYRVRVDLDDAPAADLAQAGRAVGCDARRRPRRAAGGVRLAGLPPAPVLPGRRTFRRGQ